MNNKWVFCGPPMLKAKSSENYIQKLDNKFWPFRGLGYHGYEKLRFLL